MGLLVVCAACINSFVLLKSTPVREAFYVLEFDF